MKLLSFMVLGAIVGPVNLENAKDPKKSAKQRQDRQCVNKEWKYPDRGGRLTQIVNHLSKICKGYIDRPNYQCRCLKRQKTLFWSLVKSRRVCVNRQREILRHQENKQKREEEKNKKRKSRSIDEEDPNILEDMLMNDDEDVIDAAASEFLDQEANLAAALETGTETISENVMDALYNEQCSAANLDDEDEAEECEGLKEAADELRMNAEDSDKKERAEIIYRIIRMHRAMENWAKTYVAEGKFCDKRAKMIKRVVKNRRRMQRKRRAYPTNPQRLKKQRKEERAKEQAKKEKQAAKDN